MTQKKQVNKFRALWMSALVLCCLLLCPPASAAERLCSLRVTVIHEEQPVQDMAVEVCRVSDGGALTPEFADFGFTAQQLDETMTVAQAEAAYQYVLSHAVHGMVDFTGRSGTVDFHDLPQGIYLVFERGNQLVSFQPYLVRLGGVGGMTEVYSAPKVISADSHSITVIVQWEDDNNAAGKRPDSVDVVLRCTTANTQAVSLRRVTLNSRCGWEHTFTRLPVNGVFDVIESNVPGCEYLGAEEVYEGFILTYQYVPQMPDDPKPDDPAPDDSKPDEPKPDEPKPDTPKLPQTGYRYWIVYTLLLGGAALVLLGLTDLLVSKEEVCGEE